MLAVSGDEAVVGSPPMLASVNGRGEEEHDAALGRHCFLLPFPLPTTEMVWVEVGRRAPTWSDWGRRSEVAGGCGQLGARRRRSGAVEGDCSSARRGGRLQHGSAWRATAVLLGMEGGRRRCDGWEIGRASCRERVSFVV